MIDATQLTNATVINHFVNSQRAKKQSSRTISNQEWLLYRLAEQLHPSTLVNADYEQLLAWQTSISNLAPSTLAGYVSGVRVFYRWLVRPMRWLSVSPAEELAIPRVPPRRPRPIPEPDFQYALSGCADPLMQIWLELGRYAGLRCCEIAWLTRDGILDDPLRLHVIGKGRRERIVFIGQELRDSLAPWMNRQGALFLSSRNTPFTPKTVSDRIGRFFDSLELPYTAHQLRHLYGSDALRRTKNLRLVQDQMGHRSPATTQVYTEVFEPDAIDLAEQLGADLRQKHRKR
jgi:site-specific recombinase XerC